MGHEKMNEEKNKMEEMMRQLQINDDINPNEIFSEKYEPTLKTENDDHEGDPFFS